MNVVDARVGQPHTAGGRIETVVLTRHEASSDAVGQPMGWSVRGFRVGGPAEHQWRSGVVQQHVVDFIDHGKVQRSLHGRGQMDIAAAHSRPQQLAQLYGRPVCRADNWSRK